MMTKSRSKPAARNTSVRLSEDEAATLDDLQSFFGIRSTADLIRFLLKRTHDEVCANSREEA